MVEEWLARHGLSEARPSPALAARLAVRQKARVAGSLLLAGLIMAAAAVQAFFLLDGEGPRVALVVLGGVMVAVVAAQAALGQWVRRVDRAAAASLPVRVAHPVRLGWRDLLGVRPAVFAVVSLAASVALGVVALTRSDPAVRDAGWVVLIGLAGVTANSGVQLRQVTTRPVVADDAGSLTADVLMRVEDARELASPALVWSLPVVLLFGVAPWWLNLAALAVVLAGVVTAHVLRPPASSDVARQAVRVA